jgi:hypothetical protein
MADFCKQCSIELFGEDFKDLAGLVTEKEAELNIVAAGLCEGCGPTFVNRNGECVYHEKAGGTADLCFRASQGDTGQVCC